jgi:hypothetical protein
MSGRIMLVSCPHCKQKADCTGLSGVVTCPHCRGQFRMAAPAPSPPSSSAEPISPVQTTTGSSRIPHQSAPSDVFAAIAESAAAKRATAKTSLSWWDNQFASFGIVAKVLLPLLCNGPALVLGIVGLIVCKDRLAKENAKWIVIFSAVVTGSFLLLYLAMNYAALSAAAR